MASDVSKVEDTNNNTLRLIYFATRQWCYILSFVHTLLVTAVNLPLDFASHHNPEIRSYGGRKWKLLTIWYNLVLAVYTPVCLYCDWYEKRGEEPPHVAVLRHGRDVVMTGLLFPVTIIGDLIFWVVYPTHREYIAPVELFVVIPTWSNWSLHIVSAVVVTIDVLTTPRQKPASLKPRLLLLYGFSIIYFFFVYACYNNGDNVYAVLEYYDDYDYILTCFLITVAFTFVFYIQFFLIKFIWANTQHDKKFN